METSIRTLFTINGSTTNSVLLGDFLILWQQDKWPQGNSPGRRPERAHLQGQQQVDEVPDGGDGHFQNNCGKMLSKDGPDLAENRHFIFQQGGAPAHNSKRAQDWLQKNLTEVWVKEIWPPSSPDWSPLDNFAWGVFELRVRAKPRNKTNDLILKIKGVMVSLARNIVMNTCKRFRSQFEAVVAADGSLID